MALTVMLICFIALMIIGFPIAFNLILSSISYLVLEGLPLTIIPQRIFEGMNGFALLAIPFFVLMGQLMLKGRLLDVLVEFVNGFVGHIKGALGLVTVGTCLFMGSIVGLAVAQAASLGSILIPAMKKDGYEPEFAAGIMSTASLLGPIMPPSVLMVVYCIAVGRTSVAGLFLAAIIPAFILALVQGIVVYRMAKKRGYPSYPKTSGREKWALFRKALPTLLLPIIVLGSIFGKICTVTEASIFGVLYAFILTTVVYKRIKWSDMPDILLETALTSGLTLLLVGAGLVASWVLSIEQVADKMIGPLSSLPTWLFLLMVNVVLLINGMFMDDGASAIVLGPIIAPIAWSMGIDPLQIGAIICINLVVGLVTPPFGIALFVTSPIAGVKIEDTFKTAIPLVCACIVVLFMITYIPQLTLWLPRTLGY